jgi:hypothetical protein
VSPYREGEAAEPAELIVTLAGAGTARSVVSLGVVGAAAAALASALGHLHASAGILGAAGALMVLRWKREAGRIVLRVASGELVLSTAGRERLRVRLSTLDDVSLDTKSIRKVEPGQNSALQFIHSNVGPEIDVARIVFHVGGRPVLYLTDAFLPSIEAVDWTGKIRSFLRTNGWTPHDERRASEPDDDAS